MPKKTVTKAVLSANRKNAKKSTGPRTAAGKSKSSQGAITHGFFAKELPLNDEEKRQLETSRRRLQSQLQPRTELQHITFAEIIACLGRCMLALRLEMRRISRIFGQDNEQQAQPNQPGGAGGCPGWYLSGKQGLRYGVQLLEDLKQEFLNSGRIDDKWSNLLDESFGPRLRQLLTEWKPPSEQASLLAEHLVRMSANFKRPLPPLEPDGSGPKAILDPYQSRDMVIKLLELEQSVLTDVWRASEQGASESVRAQNAVVDLAPRYFSSACRDLHRAIDRYMDLKKNKL
jgi:hypothetical protein